MKAVNVFVWDSLGTFLGEGGRRGKKRKKSDSESFSGEEGSDEERPTKKRGRPQKINKEIIKGFSEAEVSSNVILLYFSCFLT